jgi:hypothetical protein
MTAAVEFAQAPQSKTGQPQLPVMGLASALSLVAAGSLLGYSMLPAGRRRLTIADRIGLGVMAACAGALVWVERQEEAAAARKLRTFIDHTRDARWLKKNPVDFG